MEQRDRTEELVSPTLRRWRDRPGVRPGRLAGGCMALLVLGLWATGSIAAEPYEQPTDRRPAEVLPTEMVVSPNHRVQDPVVADGYMYHFTVGSSFGTFEVTGAGAVAQAPQRDRRYRCLAGDQNGQGVR